MATIQNERDKLLQAAAVRFIPPPIPPSRIPGLTDTMNDVNVMKPKVEDLEYEVNHLMDTSRSFNIQASALAFLGATGSTSPASITLNAVRGTGLVGGTITWSVYAGTGTVSPSGDTATIFGSSVTGQSVTIRARLAIGVLVQDAYITLERRGAISAQDSVNLTNQVTGQLAAGNVTGLGALAMLNTVDLNTQTVGALNNARVAGLGALATQSSVNALNQVTNLGNLAFANAIAANQIGAGTLAAGVVYAGDINANNITSGTLTGRTIQTSNTYPRVVIDAPANSIQVLDSPGNNTVVIGAGSSQFITSSGILPSVRISKSSGNQPALDVLGPPGQSGLIIRLPLAATAAPLRLDTSPALPVNRTEGSICFNGGWLCFANGFHWFRSDGSQLT